MSSPSMFKAIYDSAWHNPVSFWLAIGAFVAYLSTRLGFLRGLCVLFAFVAAADALLGGGLSPLTRAPKTVSTVVAFAFVVLGDLRYFLLLVRFSRQRLDGRAWLTAAGLSLTVPLVVTPLFLAKVPDRYLWLTYEAAFVALALAIRQVALPRVRGSVAPRTARYLTELTTFEIAQYGLWVAADLVLLSGSSFGYVVRLVPNLLYYGAFLPFVWWRAPEPLRTS